MPILFKPLSFEDVLLYAVNPNPHGNTSQLVHHVLAYFPLALNHIIAWIGNVLLLVDIYLNPVPPLEDGLNCTSHMRLSFTSSHELPTPTP